MTNTSDKSREMVLNGIGVSPGVVMGPVVLVTPQTIDVVERTVSPEEVEKEIARFEDALIETRRQLYQIQKDLQKSSAGSDASILDAHLMVLDDRAFTDGVIEDLRTKFRNAEAVVKKTAEGYAAVLAMVDDEYLKERVADIKDVGRRIIGNLTGNPAGEIRDELQHKHIIVAPDLAPSETASLRKDMVIGFATDLGSPTSHTAVMARALEIPAIVGLHDITHKVSTGDEILIDGNKGVLIISPSPERLEEYGRVAQARKNIRKGLSSLKHEPAETRDGHRIVLSGNIEKVEDVEAIVEYGAEGVGLFRSEYLYLSRDRPPTEAEETEAYQTVASRLAPDPVIVRTLDLGGDKFVSDVQLPREMNPFLGCRAIRLCLLQPDRFKTQLRAILRANTRKNIKLMYPMVSNVSEIIQANGLLEQAKKELAESGEDFEPDVEVGVMIEIPSAALTADLIARHVDFMSIGTNDLIQYTVAVDRVNERVAYLYEPTHPAVLQLIKGTIDAGHRHGTWVGVCGEMAGDPVMTGLLLGMGVDELSVAPQGVPLIKDVVRSMTYSRTRELAQKAMVCESAVEVLSHCRKLMKEVAPEILELV
jgi:phosphotransferase system enzyme I (PtsI)